MDGNKVYYGGERGEDRVALHHVPATGAPYVLSAHSHGPLSDVALTRVAAPEKRRPPSPERPGLLDTLAPA